METLIMEMDLVWDNDATERLKSSCILALSFYFNLSPHSCNGPTSFPYSCNGPTIKDMSIVPLQYFRINGLYIVDLETGENMLLPQWA